MNDLEFRKKIRKGSHPFIVWCQLFSQRSYAL